MQAHMDQFRVTSMCRVLGVQRSGFYAWYRRPHSARHGEDQRLLGLIRQAWQESGGVYGYRKVTDDLRDLGERCGKHRVARLMRGEGLRAQVGYGRRPRSRGGRVSMVAPAAAGAGEGAPSTGVHDSNVRRVSASTESGFCRYRS